MKRAARFDPHRLLAGLVPSRMRFGLERVRAAVAQLDHPESRYPTIHVAGTNGKGSTCAYLSSVLRAAGQRVGVYTSPHLNRFNERIAVQGKPIDDDDLTAAMHDVLDTVPDAIEGAEALTYFEFATVVAFEHFARTRVDVAILETGLGGRLDATNVVVPACSVVTRIALDHTEILGTTLEQIATEKAGIFKAGVPAVSGPQVNEAAAALEAGAKRAGAPLRFAKVPRPGKPFSFSGKTFSVPEIALPLEGRHQIENASIACATLEVVADRFPVTARQAQSGLAATSWPGRMEWRGRFVLDGAHNPDAARVLRQALDSGHPGPRRLVFGVLADKDYSAMIPYLFRGAAAIHLVAPANERALDPSHLIDAAKRTTPSVTVHKSVPEALRAAAKAATSRETIVVCGSLYLVGEAREWIDGRGRIVPRRKAVNEA